MLHRYLIKKPRKTIINFIALLFTINLMFFASAQDRAVKEKFDDGMITDAITNNLISSDLVDIELITIQTDAGIVTFEGEVQNILSKEKATEIAEHTRGVRSVINKLIVTPVAKTDIELEAHISSALTFDNAVNAENIGVSVDDGFVSLTGEAASYTEKQLAETITKKIEGVGAVENSIAITYSGNRSDADIKADIENRFKIDTYIEENDIHIHVNDGMVTLSGEVESIGKKNYLYRQAYVAGVEKVNADGLIINYFMAEDSKKEDPVTEMSNDMVENAVNDALLYDDRTNPFTIYVDVDGHVATLSGAVDNITAKIAAGQNAKNTVGVSKVFNNIVVVSDNYPDDKKIEKNLRSAIEWNPLLDEEEISVNVDDHVAVLNGKVKSFFEKSFAEEAAAGIFGVISIVNNLKVAGNTAVLKDEELKDMVEYELFWSTSVDREDIDISVDEGEVTLKGTVDSWKEYESAVEETFDAGATAVKNNLVISGSGPGEMMYHPDYYHWWITTTP